MDFKANGLTSASHQTFAGAFDLGVSQAGFTMVHKSELKGAFGMQNVVANKDLISNGDWSWDSTGADNDVSKLHAPQVDAVFGNPPCSGFSVMTTSHFRGVDSPVNACMKSLMTYAARCSPSVVVMESVQAAFSEGYPLMRILRDIFEREAGLEGRVWINHVLHNAGLVGNTAERRRYFLVLTVDRPFIVHDSPAVLGAADRCLAHAIADLEQQPIAVESRNYVAPSASHPYAVRARGDMQTVDGHFTKGSQNVQDIANLLALFGDSWPQGDHLSHVLTEYYDRTGELPSQFDRVREKLIDRRDPKHGFQMGFHQPTRWEYDRPSRVITGGGPDSACHPTLNRTLTFRELARIMGYPDNWMIAPNAGISAMPMWWGKQPCVECGKWVADDVRRWFNEEVHENLDPDFGTSFPDNRYEFVRGVERELVFDHTKWPRDLDGPKFRGRTDETMFKEFLDARAAHRAAAAQEVLAPTTV